MRWDGAKDGIIRNQRDNPATLTSNYYSVLEESEDTISTPKRQQIRPELLQYGIKRLKAETKILQLSQNATTLEMKNETAEIKTKSTQTPDTLDTTTDQSISFESASTTGLSAPAVLACTESDSSTKIAISCFEAGELGESSSEAADRHRQIERNTIKKKRRRDKRRRRLNQRLQRLLEQQLREDMSEEERFMKEEGSSTAEPKAKVLKQGALNLTIDDINPHDLYQNQDTPLQKQPIDLLYDTGASITMLPLDYAPAWRNLRPCLHQLTGCFASEGTQNDLQIGEFHGLLKLDNDEVVRIIIPEAIALPPDTSTTYLLSDTQFLLAGNQYKSDLREPQIIFESGGTHTMTVKVAHKVIEILPTRADETTTHRQVYAHLTTKYDPPTYHNNAVHTRRPNAQTPPAYQWHLRFGCACEEVLRRTQVNVTGMQIQKDSWKQLKDLLPCSACIAGKMRKSNNARATNYTDIQNLYLKQMAAKQLATFFNNRVSTTTGDQHEIAGLEESNANNQHQKRCSNGTTEGSTTTTVLMSALVTDDHLQSTVLSLKIWLHMSTTLYPEQQLQLNK
jgi:hypothetical protein